MYYLSIIPITNTIIAPLKHTPNKNPQANVNILLNFGDPRGIPTPNRLSRNQMHYAVML